MIGKKIKNIAKSHRVLFTTPSHDRLSFVAPSSKELVGSRFFMHDLSEINDLDNLAEPEGDILASLKYSASLLDVQDLFYLVNGSTSGIISAMCAVLSPSDKVLIARNCHKSVINGLIISGAEPVWLLPEFDSEWSVFKGIYAGQVQDAFLQNPDIKAVIITSPTYEGIDSDVASIAKVCHNHNAFLIVDQAHGALKSFAPDIFGYNAVKLGADICVQSLHKTCGAPNPSAILISNGSINRDKIQSALNLTNTSSPSFPILASIESTVSYLCSLTGRRKIEKLVSDILDFKKTFENNSLISFHNENDITKIMLKISGLSGFALSDILFDTFGIEDELANNSASVLLTGIGTTKRKLNKLRKALKIILSEKYSSIEKFSLPPVLLPESTLLPREAFFAQKEIINIENSCGKISAESITEYPPGIPLLIPGEKISLEHINYLKTKQSLIKIVR